MPRLAATLVLEGSADPARLLARFAPFAAEDTERASGEVRFCLYGASATIRREGMRVVVAAEAEDAGALATLKHMIAHTVLQTLGPGAPSLCWSGEGADSRDLPQFRAMRVEAAWDVTPRMRRVRLAGENLARFAAGGLHVRLLIPPAGRAPVWPHAGPAAIPAWPGGASRLTVRTYTIRRLDPAAGFLDVDVVLHEGASPGSDWAGRARRGDPVGIMGPGGGAGPSGRFVLAGDETALPAIARILEEQPADAVGLALVEVHDEAERQALHHPPGVAVRWLSRVGRPPGTTTLLTEAVESLSPDEVRNTFFWSGTEFATFKRLRRHCRQVLKLRRDRHAVASYWRRGRAESEPGEG